MLNGGHCATGVLSGAGLVAVTDAAGLASVSPGAYLVYTAVTAGAALFPDIDHSESMVTKSGGDVTGSLSETLQGIARFTYWATSGPHDNHTSGAGEHRGLLHTWPFALLVGGGVWWGTTLSPWVGPVALVLLLAPAIRSLAWTVHENWGVLVASLPVSRWRRNKLMRPLDLRVPRWLRLRSILGAFLTAVAATAGLTWGYGWQLYGPLFAVSITVGMLTHIGGDGATQQGAPMSWPFKRRCDRCREHGGRPCQRWKRCFSLPRWARWSVGDRHTPEPLVTVASLVVAGVVIAYGVG